MKYNKGNLLTLFEQKEIDILGEHFYCRWWYEEPIINDP